MLIGLHLANTGAKMSNERMDYESRRALVFQAATEIAETGQVPSLEAVKLKVGGGSYPPAHEPQLRVFDHGFMVEGWAHWAFVAACVLPVKFVGRN